jgi:hypothetical protein
MKTPAAVLTLIGAGAVAIGVAEEPKAKSQVATKHVLALEGARRVSEAAAKYAQANDAAPSIAVVDEG